MVFQMGHSGYKPRGVKHKATLEKEQRRAIFDARVSQKWEETIEKLKPEYIADQFMGPVTQKHEVEFNPSPLLGGQSNGLQTDNSSKKTLKPKAKDS